MDRRSDISSIAEGAWEEDVSYNSHYSLIVDGPIHTENLVNACMKVDLQSNKMDSMTGSLEWALLKMSEECAAVRLILDESCN